MPFNSYTASLAGKKSKRGKSKLSPNIQDKLDLLVSENIDCLLGSLDELSNSEKIKLIQILLNYTVPKIISKPMDFSGQHHEDLPLFVDDIDIDYSE